MPKTHCVAPELALLLDGSVPGNGSLNWPATACRKLPQRIALEPCAARSLHQPPLAWVGALEREQWRQPSRSLLMSSAPLVPPCRRVIWPLPPGPAHAPAAALQGPAPRAAGVPRAAWAGGSLRALLPLLLLVASLLVGATPLWSLGPDAWSPADPAAAGAAPIEAASLETASLEAGARLFEAHCIGCHLGGGNIIRRGRTLKRQALERADLASPEAIAQVAAAGLGQMSGYGAVLGPGGSEQVAAWVWQQALAGWPKPARPRPDSTAP